MVGAGGEIFVFWLPRTQENAIPDAFSRFAMVYLKMRHKNLPKNFILQQKSGAAMAPAFYPVAWALLQNCSEIFRSIADKLYY